MKLTGSCHCGRSTVIFGTRQALEEFVVRTCQCSFCRKHGARTIADPEGALTIHLAPDDLGAPYSFGPRTADFLICHGCGAYLAAVVHDGASSFSTLNINILDGRESFPAEDTPVVYDDETPEDRLARRLAAWTLTQLVEAFR